MSRVEEEAEEIILQALTSRDRRNVLKIVGSSSEGVLYSDVLGELGLSTGRLNYHLKQLEGFLERDRDRRYHLTPLGNRAIFVLQSMVKDLDRDVEGYLHAARSAQTRSIHPAVSRMIYLLIAFDCLALLIWGFIAYVIVLVGAPFIFYIILPVLFALGIATLVWLIRALRTAPEYIRRLEERLGLNR